MIVVVVVWLASKSIFVFYTFGYTTKSKKAFFESTQYKVSNEYL